MENKQLYEELKKCCLKLSEEKLKLSEKVIQLEQSLFEERKDHDYTRKECMIKNKILTDTTLFLVDVIVI
jgi:hypothetical protein